jgi:hypothetical protein
LLQTSFGRFDGRFLGVGLHAGDRQAFALLNDSIYGRFPDEAAVWWGAPDAAARVALLTTLAHETRHFHDYLLSPIGAASFRQLFFAQHMTKQLVVVWLAGKTLDGATCLPVPIPRWLRLDDAERTAFLERIRAFAPEAESLRPPGFGPDPLQRLVFDIAACYERVWELWETPAQIRTLGVTPTHVWEASAILTQMAEADRRYGVRGREALSDHLYGQGGNTYTHSVRALRSSLGGVEDEVKPGLFAAMVTWSLLGDERDPPDLASPAARFLLLADHLEKTGVPPRGMGHDPAALFRQWDAALQYPSWEEGLRWSLEADRRFADLLAEDDHRAEAQRYRTYLFSRKRCVEAFLSAPHFYVNPYTYLERAGAALPLAPILVRISDTAWWGEEAPMHYTTYATVEGAALASPLQAWTEDSGVDIRFAESLLQECAVAEMLFCEHRNVTDALDEAAVRRLFALRLLFVRRDTGRVGR